jgi:hypothetical protein
VKRWCSGMTSPWAASAVGRAFVTRLTPVRIEDTEELLLPYRIEFAIEPPRYACWPSKRRSQGYSFSIRERSAALGVPHRGYLETWVQDRVRPDSVQVPGGMLSRCGCPPLSLAWL